MDTPRPFALDSMQAALAAARLDGWLFYDFRGSDPIARKVLRLAPGRTGTRRWFYYVPARGEPRKLVHAIETGALDALPGPRDVYLTWQSLDAGLERILMGARRVAMQYSPRGDVPYVAKVDGGTLERVRSCGVEIVSSADLIQVFEASLDEAALESHRRAAMRLRSLVDEVFALVRERLSSGGATSEREIVDHANAALAASGLVHDHDPIAAVNEHAADPHYEVPASGSRQVRAGDLLLFDVWAKEEHPGAVYADITWCAHVGEPPDEVLRVFDVVKSAREAVIARADAAFRSGEEIRGFELDRIARKVIADAGYGEYFIHRTGHSIHEETHGNGANLDDLETHDTRRMLPRTLFSVEPGIYLPGRFGIRSEVDVYHTGKGAEVTGGPRQEALVVLEI